MLKPLVDRACY